MKLLRGTTFIRPLDHAQGDGGAMLAVIPIFTNALYLLMFETIAQLKNNKLS